MASSKDLFSLDDYRAADSVGYCLGRARAKLARALDVALAEHGITHTQGGILMLLSKGKCALAAELSRELYIDSASMTRMIDRLENRGLIVREPSSEDRRITSLRLTPKGKSLAKRLPSVYVGVLNRSFAGFSQDEVRTFKDLLHKFLSHEPDETSHDA